MPTKRKLKQCKPARDEVTQDVRQRYVNMFTEEFHKTIPNIYDAFERVSLPKCHNIHLLIY